MSAECEFGAVLWGGVESPELRTIDDAFFGPQWLSEKFNEQAEQFSVLFNEFARQTDTPVLNSFEKDAVYVAWRDLAFEIERFYERYGNALSCIHLKPGTEGRPQFLPCGPVSVSVRQKLQNFFDIIMKRLDEAELPIRRLDAAVKGIDIGEAIGAGSRVYRKVDAGASWRKSPQ